MTMHDLQLLLTIVFLLGVVVGCLTSLTGDPPSEN